MDKLYLIIPLAPLLGAIVAGLCGRQVGRRGAHWVTIAGVGLAFALSLVAFYQMIFGGGEVYDETVYTWLQIGGLQISVGFLIDPLTVTMMVVVSGRIAYGAHLHHRLHGRRSRLPAFL